MKSIVNLLPCHRKGRNKLDEGSIETITVENGSCEIFDYRLLVTVFICVSSYIICDFVWVFFIFYFDNFRGE